jgi:Flagellar hook-length control protein FliK
VDLPAAADAGGAATATAGDGTDPAAPAGPDAALAVIGRPTSLLVPASDPTRPDRAAPPERSGTAVTGVTGPAGPAGLAGMAGGAAASVTAVTSGDQTGGAGERRSDATADSGNGTAAGDPTLAPGAAAAVTAPDRPAGDSVASPVSVADQVARHVTAVRTMADGSHRTVLRLEPEHLGALTLTVSVRAGRVRLEMSGSAAAMSALDADLGALREQLGAAGLGLDGVTLQPAAATGSGGQAGDQRSENGQNPLTGGGPGTGDAAPGNRGEAWRASSAEVFETEPTPAAAATPETRPPGPGAPGGGGVDVRV